MKHTKASLEMATTHGSQPSLREHEVMNCSKVSAVLDRI